MNMEMIGREVFGETCTIPYVALIMMIVCKVHRTLAVISSGNFLTLPIGSRQIGPQGPTVQGPICVEPPHSTQDGLRWTWFEERCFEWHLLKSAASIINIVCIDDDDCVQHKVQWQPLAVDMFLPSNPPHSMSGGWRWSEEKVATEGNNYQLCLHYVNIVAYRSTLKSYMTTNINFLSLLFNIFEENCFRSNPQKKEKRIQMPFGQTIEQVS